MKHVRTLEESSAGAGVRAVGVQSVERAFTVLEALGAESRPLGVTELASSTGLSPATIHRLLGTLADLGYVRHDPARTYALGHSLIRLGERAASSLAARSLAYLQIAARDLDESVNLALLENDQVVYIAHAPSIRSVRTFTEVGSRVPAHSTGVGKAMLASMDDSQVRALLDRTGMPAATGRTITHPQAFLTAMHAIRDRGFAVDDEEQEVGVRCVAVSVPGSLPPLAVSVSGPAFRVSDEVVAAALPVLLAVAASIAREMTSPERQ